MNTYHSLLNHVLTNGISKSDRTGTGTISLIGTQSRYDLSNGRVPVVTTKKIHLKSVIHELLWFLSGDTNINYLKQNGVNIWNEWADKFGDLGRVYGAQWREFLGWRNGDASTTDQIHELMYNLERNPFSRRHIVSAWNPVEIDDMALPPCHCLFQFFVEEDAQGQKHLTCQLYQRSADLFLGVPFNIASYSILTHMIAHCLGYKAKEFIHTIGDAHIYSNHIPQVKQQLLNQPFAPPTITLNPDCKDLDSFKYEDITINNYRHHAAIPAPVAI